MTLYLKYRSKNLDEIDLGDVSELLKKVVKSGEIPHAFLFAGPKGTGKTSAARILAKMINCESKNPPCDKCDQCLSIAKGTNLDVVEMDAASHRGIDDVRMLRDAVKLAPIKAKKKIYIIDEAHMLTTEASNALLKTLEEPPSHVIFILATTNPEKLIDTIKSRTTYINFRKATTEEIIKSLKRVVEGEKIKIEENALRIIAESAGGAFRDAIKILEQMVLEKVDLSEEFLGKRLLSKGELNLDKFIELLSQKSSAPLILEVERLVKSGISIDFFLESLLARLQSGLLTKIGVEGEDIEELDKGSLMELIELFSKSSREMPDSPIEELPFEIAIIKWCDGAGEKPQPVHFEEKPVVKEVVSKEESVEMATPVVTGGMDVNDEAWKNILSTVKPINASIEALLRAARPVGYDGKTLTLGVFYKFHKERLEDPQHRRVLESVVGEILKSPTKVTCTLVEPPVRKIIEEAKVETVLTEGEDKDIIKVAEEIFGN